MKLTKTPRLKQTPINKRLEEIDQRTDLVPIYFTEKADKITKKADKYSKPL